MNIDTTAESVLIGSDSSSASDDTSSPRVKKPKGRTARAARISRLRKRKIEAAVFSYIRAVRTLGRTKTNTAEIAEALSLTPSEVRNATAALKSKGVKEL